MSLWSEPNRDAYTMDPQDAAVGPRLGFLGAFEAALDQQIRANSFYATAAALRDEEQENIRRIREAGEVPPAPLNDMDADLETWLPFSQNFGPYSALFDTEMAIRQRRRNFAPSEDTRRYAALAAERDRQLRQLRERLPNAGIRTYDEMVRDVRTRAQEAERRMTFPQTFGGNVGAFLGGMVGSVNPRTDPLNFITLGVGGAGRTVLQRIAGQAGAQAVVETGNQFLVQPQREQLGLPSGFGYGAASVLAAAGGGAILQGVGEGAGALVRRWFRVSPNDPAPPAPAPPPPAPTRTVQTVRQPPAVPPQPLPGLSGVDAAVAGIELGRTRVGRARIAEDLAHVTRQLDAFDGPRPWEVSPPTATRLPLRPGDMRADVALPVRNAGATLDEVARQIDPETFRIYDALADRREALRTLLRAREVTRSESSAKLLDQQIQAVQDRIARTKKGKQLQRLQTELSDLMAQRDAMAKEAKAPVGTNLAEARAELLRADERMRDLAPAVSRAYARAQGKWTAYEAQRAQIAAMIDGNKKGLAELPPLADVLATPEKMAPTLSLPEKLPMLAARPDLVESMPGADAADMIMKAVEESMKVVDEAVDEFRAAVSRVVEGDNMPPVLEPVAIRNLPPEQRMAEDAWRRANAVSGLVDAIAKRSDMNAAQIVAELRDELSAVFPDVSKAYTEAVMFVRAVRDKIREGVGTQGTIRIEGVDTPIRLDERLQFEDANGNVREGTVREMLQEVEDDNVLMRAVTTCSTGKSS